MTKTTCRLFLKLAAFSLSIVANAATPAVIDRGPLPEQERHTPISVTVTPSLPGLAAAEKLQQAIYTPGAPEYHQFLTAEQFAARFAPSGADIAKLVDAFARYGLTARCREAYPPGHAADKI